MFIYDSEKDRKKFMESSIKQSIGWIKLCEESVSYYQDMVKTYKDFLIRYPANSVYGFGLEIYEVGLIREKELLKQGRKRLTGLLEDYDKSYGKKETLKLKVNTMGLKVIKNN